MRTFFWTLRDFWISPVLSPAIVLDVCGQVPVSHNCYCNPASERGSKLAGGAGTPSAPGLLVTRRVTDLLDDGSILLCETTIGATENDDPGVKYRGGLAFP
eukprot:462501-Prorocentrum_minimum.AAC.1